MIAELNGTWILQRQGSTEQIEARVPGCVHTDLLAAGDDSGSIFGANEEALRWIFRRSLHEEIFRGIILEPPLEKLRGGGWHGNPRSS